MSFIDAKIIGTRVDPSVYHRQGREDVKRGDADFIMSRSELKNLLHCPHRWLGGYKSESNDSTEWGDLLDCLALTPDSMNDRFAIAPEKYKAVGMQCPICESVTDSAKCSKCKTERVRVEVEKEWNWNAAVCDDWRKKQGSKTIIKADLMQSAVTAQQALLSDRMINDLIRCSQTQVFVMGSWKDAETGIVVPVKALLDLVPDKNHTLFGRCLGDFKTARDAGQQGWAKVVYQHGYDMQAALHTDLYVAATGEDRTDWVHAIQENFPPYETGKRAISTEFIEAGRMRYQNALKVYARCLKTGVWPRYDDDDFTVVDPEPWMLQAALRTTPELVLPPEPEYAMAGGDNNEDGTPKDLTP